MIDYVYISFIAIALCIGLICTNRSSHISYKLLNIFLAVTLCNEVLCFILKKQYINTHLNYNIYYYFRFPFLGFIYYKLHPSYKIVPSLVKFFLALTVILFLLSLYLYNGITKLHTIYLLAGGIFVILLSLLHFYILLKNEDAINPFQARFFWVATGLFFYFLGILPFLGILNFLVKKDLIFASHQLIIAKLLSVLLYSLIMIDYLIQWKQMKLKY
jgi:hypothetical protein